MSGLELPSAARRVCANSRHVFVGEAVLRVFKVEAPMLQPKNAAVTVRLDCPVQLEISKRVDQRLAGIDLDDTARNR
ncbi:hypothetical protein ACI2KT_25845 [Ensifer adhaerens]|uniref:hypothetical protein n=1 Tax=Ensifer adhaerens TaxID=106592 RepID=UPI0011BE0188|nr:hypothetical protein [Ensifer adhaerens]